MKRKFLIGALCLTLCTTLLLSGCNNNANLQAANKSRTTASRAQTVVKRLDTYSNEKFNFPSALGENFFETQKSTKSPKIVNATPPMQSKRYMPKFFTKSELNNSCPIRTQYLNRLDDLYALCADITMANEYKEELIEEIKFESERARSLGSEFKKNSQTKSKRKKTNQVQNLDSLNQIRKETDISIRLLNRDKGHMTRPVKRLPKSDAPLCLDSLEKQYLEIMSHLESRITKLENVLNGLLDMNYELRTALCPHNNGLPPKKARSNNRKGSKSGRPTTLNLYKEPLALECGHSLEQWLSSNLWHSDAA